MNMEEVVGELLDRTGRVVALRPPPARVDRRPEDVAVAADLREDVARRLLVRVVLDPQAHSPLAQDRHDAVAVAGESGADHVGAERGCDLAGPLQVRWPDPSRVRRHTQPVRVQERACRLDVLVRRPLGIEVRAPQIDRLEAEAADVAQELVEALLVRLERPERVVRGAVAVAPAVHRVPDLARDVVRAHEGDGRHRASTCPSARRAICSSSTSTSCTATPRRAACAAATPAACPSSISVGSIRTDPNATCDADRQSGTSRFSASSRRGVSARYGIGYGGTATERYPSLKTAASRTYSGRYRHVRSTSRMSMLYEPSATTSACGRASSRSLSRSTYSPSIRLPSRT